jgi:hypothetical protein
MLGEAMTIKIKAPRAYSDRNLYRAQQYKEACTLVPVRIVRESDWRKLMKLVKAADGYRGGDGWFAQLDAIIVARDALEKKK